MKNIEWRRKKPKIAPKEKFYLQNETGLFFQFSSAALQSNLKTHFKAFSFQLEIEKVERERDRQVLLLRLICPDKQIPQCRRPDIWQRQRRACDAGSPLITPPMSALPPSPLLPLPDYPSCVGPPSHKDSLVLEAHLAPRCSAKKHSLVNKKRPL